MLRGGCVEMTPRHTSRGFGGGIFFDDASRVPNKLRLGVLVNSFHPLLTHASTHFIAFRVFWQKASMGPPWGLQRAEAAFSRASSAVEGPGPYPSLLHADFGLFRTTCSTPSLPRPDYGFFRTTCNACTRSTCLGSSR